MLYDILYNYDNSNSKNNLLADLMIPSGLYIKKYNPIIPYNIYKKCNGCIDDNFDKCLNLIILKESTNCKTKKKAKKSKKKTRKK